MHKVFIKPQNIKGNIIEIEGENFVHLSKSCRVDVREKDWIAGWKKLCIYC